MLYTKLSLTADENNTLKLGSKLTACKLIIDSTAFAIVARTASIVRATKVVIATSIAITASDAITACIVRVARDTSITSIARTIRTATAVLALGVSTHV